MSEIAVAYILVVYPPPERLTLQHFRGRVRAPRHEGTEDHRRAMKAPIPFFLITDLARTRARCIESNNDFTVIFGAFVSRCSHPSPKVLQRERSGGG